MKESKLSSTRLLHLNRRRRRRVLGGEAAARAAWGGGQPTASLAGISRRSSVPRRDSRTTLRRLDSTRSSRRAFNRCRRFN